jgi:hypothetical protein
MTRNFLNYIRIINKSRKSEKNLQHAHGTALPGLLRHLGLSLNLMVQLFLAIIISNYSPSHSEKGMKRTAALVGLWKNWNQDASGVDLSSTVCLILPPWGLVTNSWEMQSQLSNCPPETGCVSNISGLLFPQFIMDPSASTFLSAVMIYCSAVLLYCKMEKSRHQDHFLVVGASLGAVSGTLAAWSESSMELLKDYIPLSITVALTMSFVWQMLPS